MTAPTTASPMRRFPSLTIPVAYRADVATYICIAAALAIGFGTSLLYRGVTLTRTVTHNRSVAQQYGKPTQSVAGAQINAALKGLTCDVYQAKATIICHR